MSKEVFRRPALGWWANPFYAKKKGSLRFHNLNSERKAQMVSNLLVVLCGEKEAHPVINAGSLY